MISRAYYRSAPLTGHLEVTRLVANKPIEYELYLSHDINGMIIKKKYADAEQAFTAAMKHGFIRNSWEKIETDFDRENNK